MMREDYVQKIKNYLSINSNYQNKEEIKSAFLRMGATEDEINEAFRQFEENKRSSNINYSKLQIIKQILQRAENKFSFKRLVEFDIITHLFVLLSISIFAAVMFISSNGRTLTFTSSIPNDIPLNDEGEKRGENEHHDLIPHVYANTQIIDSNKVFSYPSSKITLTVSGKPKKEIFGFFPYWMIENEEKINLNYITTISLFGLETDGNGNIITVREDGKEDGGWAMWNNPKLDSLINKAKKRRINLQLTIKAFNNNNIEKLVLSDKAQETFISNIMHLINTKRLDGINLDFEYVGNPSEKIRNGFTRLVTNLRSEMKRQLPSSRLTICTYISQATDFRLIDIEILEELVDAYIIMGYDFNTPQGDPGPIAPMEGSYSIMGFMQSYLEKVSPEKLILAVPYYGYDWVVPNIKTSENSNNTNIIPYAEIAANSKSYNIQWDDTSQTPFYKYIDSQTNQVHIVHFENTRSLSIKYDYINNKNLRGVGIWALGYDGLNNDLRTLLIEKFSK